MSFFDYTPVGARHGGETKLWDGYMLGLKGLIARGAEEARQAVHQDFAYTGEYPYALALHIPSDFTAKLKGGTGVFMLPVGPQSVSLSRIFKQRVVSTLGGIFAQEAGYNAWDLKVDANFGLSPKHGFDQTDVLNVDYQGDQLPEVKSAFSGPKWTLRLLRHFFDRYAALKANPKYAHETYMSYHNFKDGQHFVVVPTQATVARNVEHRMMYPLSMEFKVIGHAEAIDPPSSMTVIGAIMAGLQTASAMAKAALNIVDDATNTINTWAGKVRGIATRLDSLQSDWETLTDNWKRSFGGTLSDGTVIEEGSTKWWTGSGYLVDRIRKAQDETREQLAAARERNADARVGGVFTELKRACDQCDDALDMVEMHLSSGDNSDDGVSSAPDPAEQANALMDNFAQSEGSGNIDYANEPQGTTPTQSQLPQAGQLADAIVDAADTLPGLAEEHLGDASLWKVLAIINELSPPYLSSTGMKNTLKPGDRIKIPVSGSKTASQIIGWNKLSGSDAWGVDIELAETSDAGPGRPLVDIVIDGSTGKDIRLARGQTNLMQAVQMRVWTTQGTMKLFPNYGLPFVVGMNIPAYSGSALQLAVRSALLEDSRVSAVGRTISNTVEDVIEIDAEVFPISTAEVVAVPVSVI